LPRALAPGPIGSPARAHPLKVAGMTDVLLFVVAWGSFFFAVGFTVSALKESGPAILAEPAPRSALLCTPRDARGVQRRLGSGERYPSRRSLNQ